MENKKNFEQESDGAEIMPLDEMADKLDALQGVKNDGRGVSCVRDIIAYLRRGDIGSARQVARTDHDKINDALGLNADIKEFIKKELFRGEAKHPWSFSEEFEKRRRKK